MVRKAAGCIFVLFLFIFIICLTGCHFGRNDSKLSIHVLAIGQEIGRASCRERVFRAV